MTDNKLVCGREEKYRKEKEKEKDEHLRLVSKRKEKENREIIARGDKID